MTPRSSIMPSPARSPPRPTCARACAPSPRSTAGTRSIASSATAWDYEPLSRRELARLRDRRDRCAPVLGRAQRRDARSAGLAPGPRGGAGVQHREAGRAGLPAAGHRLSRPLLRLPTVSLGDPVRVSGRSAGRVVVTVHDLAALREPSAYPARAVWLRRRSLERLRRSEAIVHAVSESTRADLLAIGRLPAARVHVVPEGVSPRFFAPIPAAERAARCRRLGLDRPFFVALGAQHPRKNLGFLLRCFRDLLRAGRYDVLLALIGPGSSAHVDDLCRRAGYEPGERARVRHLGPLSDEAVRTCLQHSLGLVFPSLYEGFGLPVLEAMASGTPVIASDRSSLPEVVGDCGILLDPGRSEPWVAAMAALLEKPAAARALAARAQIRARRFTWTAAARRLLALLEVPLA